MTNDLPEDLTLLTEDEAAKILRQRVKTLQNWRWKGTGPRPTKLGRKVLYRLSDLRAYLAGPQPDAAGERGGAPLKASR